MVTQLMILVLSFVHDYRDEITAVSTAIIAIFTAVLGCFTISLAKSTRIAARAAEKALTELERPWVFLEGARIRRRELPGERITPNNWWIEMHWKNIGRAPAIIEECVFGIEPKSTLPKKPVYAKDHRLICPRTIAAGDVVKTNEVGPAPGTDELLVFFGKHTYKELNGQIHEAGFALEISPHMPAFSSYDSDQYTYYHP
jgi:hypothetical protein